MKEMNDKNDFALVPRPPSEIEKAEPGTKRVLSSMISETLALAKTKHITRPSVSVAICGFLFDGYEGLQSIYRVLLRDCLADQASLECKFFAWTTDLTEAARQSQFNLFILVLNPALNARKEYANHALDRAPTWADNGDEINAYEFIASLKLEFKKPIFVISNGLKYDLDNKTRAAFQRAGADAIFGMPHGIEEFRSALQGCLKIPSVEATVEGTQLPGLRALRVVIVNDELGPLKSFEIIIRERFKNATILLFDDPVEAWQELSKSNPDLLITDDRMHKIGGDELCERLLARQVTYPIILNSAFEPKEPEWVRGLARRGLNISFLHVPCDIDSIVKSLETALKIPRDTTKQSQIAISAAQLEDWYRTGEKYFFGREAPKDYTEAFKWYYKAAEHGHSEAQNSIGAYYERGLGIPKDYLEAVKWYRRAAEQGHDYAQNNLGACYANGIGVQKDRTEALKWYRMAADQGNELAKTNLGLLNEKWEGAFQFPEAVESLRNMADQGFAPAQYNLGICYEQGRGVLQDFPEAYKLYKLASEQNREDAAADLKRIVTRMTAAEITEGERRYSQFRVNH
jgi:CheY-like chemotaxis protein